MIQDALTKFAGGRGDCPSPPIRSPSEPNQDGVTGPNSVNGLRRQYIKNRALIGNGEIVNARQESREHRSQIAFAQDSNEQRDLAQLPGVENKQNWIK